MTCHPGPVPSREEVAAPREAARLPTMSMLALAVHHVVRLASLASDSPDAAVQPPPDHALGRSAQAHGHRRLQKLQARLAEQTASSEALQEALQARVAQLEQLAVSAGLTLPPAPTAMPPHRPAGRAANVGVALEARQRRRRRQVRRRSPTLPRFRHDSCLRTSTSTTSCEPSTAPRHLCMTRSSQSRRRSALHSAPRATPAQRRARARTSPGTARRSTAPSTSRCSPGRRRCRIGTMRCETTTGKRTAASTAGAAPSSLDDSPSPGSNPKLDPDPIVSPIPQRKPPTY